VPIASPRASARDDDVDLASDKFGRNFRKALTAFKLAHRDIGSYLDNDR
jgi:hypothetical protein